MLLCYFWLLYHHYIIISLYHHCIIIVSSLYHHCIIIGLQPADSRRDSLKKGGRLTCVNNKYSIIQKSFFWGGLHQDAFNISPSQYNCNHYIVLITIIPQQGYISLPASCDGNPTVRGGLVHIID